MAMSTADATAVVARNRPSGAIVISTMSTLRTFPTESPNPLNLSCVPLMGGASAMGLGIALAQPERHVIVLDGDGSLLMQLGSLATVAGAAPTNLFHFVFENGVWFEGGADIPVPGSNALDWTGIARGAGYPATHSFDDPRRLDTQLPDILASAGPCFIRLDIDPGQSDKEPWSGSNQQEETPDLQFARMGNETRAMKTALQETPPPQPAARSAVTREETR